MASASAAASIAANREAVEEELEALQAIYEEAFCIEPPSAYAPLSVTTEVIAAGGWRGPAAGAARDFSSFSFFFFFQI